MPLIAFVNGARSLAAKDGPRRATCPGCDAEMIAHTGEVVSWHWAHHPGDDTPCMTEPETEWHIKWKSRAADPGRIEVPSPDGSRRADVLTPYGYAVEFQHSSLSVSEVAGREQDWRGRIIWAIDSQDAYENARLTIWRPPEREHWTIEWAWAPAWATRTRARTFVDLDGERLLLLGRWFDKHPRRPIRGYGWDITADQFERCVLNGVRPPQQPGYHRPLNPEAWANPMALAGCRVCGREIHADHEYCSRVCAMTGKAEWDKSA